jgi:hypothetical protein
MMNDKQIVEYCKNLIEANLNQYAGENPALILNELYELDNDKTNKTLLEHCKGVIALLEKCIKILENKNDKNK